MRGVLHRSGTCDKHGDGQQRKNEYFYRVSLEQNPDEIKQSDAKLDVEGRERAATSQQSDPSNGEWNDSSSGCDSFLTTG